MIIRRRDLARDIRPSGWRKLRGGQIAESGGSARYRPVEWPHADQSVLGFVGLASRSAAQLAMADIPPGWYAGPLAGGVIGEGW
jgi:hypothetical protein